jgi:hypothetical protein
MSNTDNLKSFVAAVAIDEFEIVAIDANGKVTLPSGGDDDGIVGVAQRSVAAGDVVDVLVYGITRVKAGAALTFVTTPLLMAATDGEVVAASGTGNYPIARVLPNINQTATAGAGEQFSAFFFGPSIALA